jgi:hypothetical protein
MNQTGRTTSWSTAAIVAVAGAALLVGVLLVDGTRSVETHLGDTGVLVQGTHTALDCIRDGTFSGCGHTAGSDSTAVGAFALFQYLFAVPLVLLGLGDATVERGLAWISTMAVAAMVVLSLTVGRRVLGRRWSVVLVLVLVSGPMVLYGLIPFGEALAAFLGLAFALAACTRRTGWVVATIFLACLTKETAAPLLLAIGIVCARDNERDGWLPPWRLLGPMVGGAAVAVVVNSAFNVFRFGTISNLTYNAPFTRVPGISLKVRLAVANWLAPNVGVLWFWTVAALVLAGVLVAAVVGVVRHPRQPRRWAPALIVVLTTAALTGALASWWSTFGWLAWGPRLTLPLLPALVVAAVRAAPGPLDAGLRALVGSTARAVATGAVIAVLAVPQSGVVWNQSAITLPTVPDATCPVLKAPWDTTPSYFYGCGLDEAWRRRPLSLWEATHGGPHTQQLAELLQVIAIAALVTWLAADVRRERRAFAAGDGAREPAHAPTDVHMAS